MKVKHVIVLALVISTTAAFNLREANVLTGAYGS